MSQEIPKLQFQNIGLPLEERIDDLIGADDAVGKDLTNGV